MIYYDLIKLIIFYIYLRICICLYKKIYLIKINILYLSKNYYIKTII